MSDNHLRDWVGELYADLPTAAGVSRCNSSEEIADLYRQWINKLASAVGERSGWITSGEASRLLFIINLVLDFIEHACDCGKLKFAEILGLLYPVEDILVGLRLAESKDPNRTGDGAIED
jgi:hypothetical protein